VAKDYQLLYTARDYFQFVTNFFEVINVSATHLYHSALELSPLSSIVRKLYYHQRPHPSPRVVIGIADSWEPTSAISTKHPYYLSSTWSPCGQFIAVVAEEAVEIWDALTLKFLSTPQSTKVTTTFRHGLAYSPDGHSLSGCSDTAIIIWDTQTGGEITKIGYKITGDKPELVWSLDGKTIGIVLSQEWNTYTVHICNTASGTTLSPGILQSWRRPYIWAYNQSFQIVAATQAHKGWTIDIFDVGSTLTRAESFPFQFDSPFEAFSPTTYRASVSTDGDHFHDPELLILDIQNSEILLQRKGSYQHHSFSADAGFFAAFVGDHLPIWRYTSSHYTQWREFQQTPAPLQFSPTSSSIMGHIGRRLRTLHLDYHPAALATKSVIATHSQLKDAFSPSGTFIATAYHGESTITITNLHSQDPFPSQFIDTDLEISAIVLTGNVLLAKGSDKIVAWLLTEEGVVDGIVGNTRADCNDSLWEMSHMSSQALATRWAKLFRQHNSDDRRQLKFSVADEIAVIQYGGSTTYAYHVGTGEVLKLAEVPQSHGRTWYDFHNQQQDECDLYHHSLYTYQSPLECEWPVSQTALQEGWVKDPEGKHRLWLHPSWGLNGNWFHNTTTLRLGNSSKLVIIKF